MEFGTDLQQNKTNSLNYKFFTQQTIMTDKFLNKLREIRQKYGVSEAEYLKSQQVNPQSFIDMRKSTLQQGSVYQAPVAAYRAKSNMKRSFHQNFEDAHQDIYDGLARKRLMSRQIHCRTPVEQNNNMRNSGLRSYKTTQRASSQPRIPLSTYNALDLQQIKSGGHKYTQQPVTNNYGRTPFSSSFTQNLKILYEPIAKPLPIIPSFSYSRQPLQTHNNNSWTIDKLSHVQDKIKAYLRK